MTADGSIFAQAVALGERLLFLHTFGRRYKSGGGTMPHGQARSTVAISDDPAKYPMRSSATASSPSRVT